MLYYISYATNIHTGFNYYSGVYTFGYGRDLAIMANHFSANTLFQIEVDRGDYFNNFYISKLI